jgi:parvulin-like peptidyl-prolyl isomerase
MAAPVTRMTRSIAALGAVFFVLVGLAACGGTSVPGNAVAVVNGQPITKDTFDHWLQIAANSSTQSPTGQQRKEPLPLPPDYTACINSLRTQLAPLLKGRKQPTTAELKAQCQQEYQAYLQQVMQFLISADWVIGEANRDGIHVSDQQVATQFNTIKKQQFPTAAAYSAFLASSGETLSDLLLRVKLELLSTQLRNHATKGTTTVTPAQMQQYYNAHKSQYASPENRNISLILTKTQAQAAAALAALKGGTPFANEAKKVSIDVATKNNGGQLSSVTRGQEEQALDAAIFSAPLNALQGPVKTPFGYYVFKVDKIVPPNQLTQAQVQGTIKQQLLSQQQQGALTKFVNNFTHYWTPITVCRAGFVVQDCKGYVAPKTTTPAGTGPTTSGG